MSSPDTKKPRQPIDEKALTAYLKKHHQSLDIHPFVISQFNYGQSNPTYLLRKEDGQNAIVLRKKPPGTLLSPTAHAVEREFRVIEALDRYPGRPVPVPKALFLCKETDVIGTPFYGMEFLKGRIFEDFLIPGVDETKRRTMWVNAVEVLARLHSVDIQKAGLETFNRGGGRGFWKRQVERWDGICKVQAKVKDVETGELVGDVPFLEEVVGFLREGVPRERVGLVHGDYKIDNLVYAKGSEEIIGVLDWEMSTLGHPLSDLSNFLLKHTLSLNTHHLSRPLRTLSAATPDSAYLPNQTPGLPTVDELVALYAARSGYDPRVNNEIGYGLIFVVFRLAAIAHGIKARWAKRQASSAGAKENGEAVGGLMEIAVGLVRETRGGLRGKL